MRPRRTPLAVAALSLAIAGCATAPSGPPAGVGPQALRLATYRWAGLTGTDPGPGRGWGAGRGVPDALPGAHCTASNDRGSWSLVTPGAVHVARSAAHLRITCRLEGYREETLELPCITPRAAAAAGGAYAGMQVAMMAIPAGAVLVPVAAIVSAIAGATVAGGAVGAAAAQAVPEPDVCAYGAGSDVQVWMRAAR